LVKRYIPAQLARRGGRKLSKLHRFRFNGLTIQRPPKFPRNARPNFAQYKGDGQNNANNPNLSKKEIHDNARKKGYE
jgi:hypothetical protein